MEALEALRGCGTPGGGWRGKFLNRVWKKEMHPCRISNPKDNFHVFIRSNFINEPPELQGERRTSVINYDPSEKLPELGQWQEDGVCCFGVVSCGTSSEN